MRSCSNGSRVAASSKRRPASREDHDAFCTTEGWELVRGATGRPVKHHRTYELRLWDGRMLRTRISRPVDRSQYAPSMWTHILHQQLEVTPGVFWVCVDDGVVPDRGAAAPVRPKKVVPLYLVRALRALGVEEKSILAMDVAEAAELHARQLAESGEQAV